MAEIMQLIGIREYGASVCQGCALWKGALARSLSTLDGQAADCESWNLYKFGRKHCGGYKRLELRPVGHALDESLDEDSAGPKETLITLIVKGGARGHDSTPV